MFGVASVAWPVIGGFFAGMDSLLGLSGWRWGFLINLPIGLVALVVVWRLFDLPHRRTDQRVDHAGCSRSSGRSAGPLGIAVAMSVVFGVLGGRLSDALRDARSTPEFQAALRDPAVIAHPASGPVLAGVRDGGEAIDLDDSSYLSDIDDRLAWPVLEGMNNAMSTAYLIIAAVMLVAVGLTLAIRQPPRNP